MLACEEPKVNGQFYKLKRSVSSNLGNYKNGESKTDNPSNSNSRGKICRHRKTVSSYFLGSYIAGEGLNNFLQEYKKTNCNKENANTKNIIPSQNNYCSNLKNLLMEKNNSNDNNQSNDSKEKNIGTTNCSFYSYSAEDENENKNKKTNNDNADDDKENGGVVVHVGGGEDKSSINDYDTKSNSFTTNNPFYELEKNNEKFGKDKSFIPIKNTLKFIKDKEERVTESYLMALNGGESNQKNGKNQYLPTASIIEEEKSEFIESTSKKKTIIKANIFSGDLNFKKRKFENEFNLIKDNDILEKSNDDENKENLDINVNLQKSILNNIKFEDENKTIKKCPKLDFDLNKIKAKNNYKEEKKRKCLRKTKENLLNYFYNLNGNGNKNLSSNINGNGADGKEQNENTSKDNNNKTTKKKSNTKLVHSNSNSNNINNLYKGRHRDLLKSSSKSIINLPLYIKINKNKRNFSYSGGYISYLYRQRFNTENNALKFNEKIKPNNISKYIYKNNEKNIIYHLYKNNCKSNKNNKQLNKSMNTQILSSGTKINSHKMKIPHKKIDKSMILNKNVVISKPNGKNNIYVNLINKKEKNIPNTAHRKSMSISRDKIDKSKNKIQKNASNGEELENTFFKRKIATLLCNNNSLNIKINTNANTNTDSSRIINQRNKQITKTKENSKIPTHSNSHSSRTKEKFRDKIINNKKDKKVLIKKCNSGLFNNKFISEIESNNAFDINISNKNQTLILLKEKIIFGKSFEKNDVIEKINKTLNCNKSSFIILCNNEEKNDTFSFSGLYKYYENQKRFIKIYGNEKVPNVLLINNINNNRYKIYESKIIQKEENKTQFFFEKIDYFYFSFNAVILCKQ